MCPMENLARKGLRGHKDGVIPQKTALIHPQHYIVIDGLMQDYSNSIANALELPQSCTKTLIHS